MVLSSGACRKMKATVSVDQKVVAGGICAACGDDIYRIYGDGICRIYGDCVYLISDASPASCQGMVICS